jgi:hypothetical protein
MTPIEMLAAAFGAGLTVGGLGMWAWWLFLLEPRIRDEGYDEGYAAAGWDAQCEEIGEWEDDEPVTGEIRPLPGVPGYLEAVRAGVPTGAALLGVGPDWRETMTAELAPEHLAAEAERIDLPGPASVGPLIADAESAGELPILEERPLPSVLHLGVEYSGDEKTFARVWTRQRMAIDRHEEARRALCVECGIKWVPMDHIALEAAA